MGLRADSAENVHSRFINKGYRQTSSLRTSVFRLLNPIVSEHRPERCDFFAVQIVFLWVEKCVPTFLGSASHIFSLVTVGKSSIATHYFAEHYDGPACSIIVTAVISDRSNLHHKSGLILCEVVLLRMLTSNEQKHVRGAKQGSASVEICSSALISIPSPTLRTPMVRYLLSMYLQMCRWPCTSGSDLPVSVLPTYHSVEKLRTTTCS
jgi:hypothetical protein